MSETSKVLPKKECQTTLCPAYYWFNLKNMRLIANFVSSCHQEESNKVDGHEKVEQKRE